MRRHGRSWKTGLAAALLRRGYGGQLATVTLAKVAVAALVAVSGCERAAKVDVPKGGPALGVGVGLSSNDDPAAAGEEAVRQALAELGAAPQLIVVFLGHAGKDAEALAGVRKAAGSTPFVACQSYVGHMVSKKYGGPDTVGAMALGGRAKVTRASATKGLEGLDTAGTKIGRALAAPDNKALFILVAAVASHKEPDVRDLLKGIRKHVPATVPVVGGNAENGEDAGVVYDGTTAMPQGVIGIMFSGDLKVGIGSAVNFDKVAGPFKITRMVGRKLHELDGKPVADVYLKAYGVTSDKVDGGFAAKNPMAVRIGGKYVIRYQRKLEPDGTFKGFPHALKEGQEVFFLKYNDDDLVASSTRSAEEAKNGLGGKPLLALASVCIGRAGFGKKQQQETDALRAGVGEDVPLFGFHACGEYFTPQWRTPDVSTEYHQLSSCVMVIGE